MTNYEYWLRSPNVAFVEKVYIVDFMGGYYYFATHDAAGLAPLIVLY
jgi:hypothetical protein